MTTLQGSWIWYELMSRDPEGSKAFYEAVVGWTMSTGHGENDMDYGFITRADGGMTGGLLRLKPEMIEHGARPCWAGYIGVDDVDAMVQAVKAAGGSVLLEPIDIAMAGRVAMVADCCGAAFYIMTPNSSGESGESTSFAALPRNGSCGWNELYCGDLERAEKFYTSLFGWTLPDAMDMGPMGKYQFFAHDGVTLGAMMKKPDTVPVSVWGHYFWVESIVAATGLIEAGGGHVVNGPMEVPGGDWIVQAIDPQCALFSLVGGP